MDLSGHQGDMPIPITSTYVGAAAAAAAASATGAGGHGHTIIQEPPPFHHPSNGPLPLSTTTSEQQQHPYQSPPCNNNNTNNKKKGVPVKYRECLKNHAASIGGNATDGCGEFMPSGEEGTLEALKCSACNCHRNFHRKEIEGEPSYCECYHHYYRERKAMGHKGLLISGPEAYSLIPRGTPHQMVMPLGAIQTSESDEMEGVGGVVARPPMVKKRFRTKFTPEQKEKMLGFAEKVGWRLQRQEESVVQQFCQEIGVKRRVLKVWMHNNKHSLAKKGASTA